MLLFFATIKRDPISLLRLPLLSNVQVILCAISLVCSVKYPYSCFSSQFCFLDFFYCCFPVCPYINSLSIAVTGCCNPSFLALVYSSSHWIVASIRSPILVSLLLLFLTYRDCLCHLLSVRPCILSSIFLFFGPTIWVFSLVHFKKSPEYLTRGPAYVPLMRFLLQSFVSRSFLFLLRYSFLTFSFIFICSIVSTSNIPWYL